MSSIEPRRSPLIPQSERGLRRETDARSKTTVGAYHHEVEKQENLDILYLLLAFRFVNALLVQTFFQPDEYFQSLEPGWQMAFGPASGAWITWASIYPYFKYTPLTQRRNGNTNFDHQCIPHSSLASITSQRTS